MELLRYKQLYHKLQNLEEYSDVLHEAQEELVRLLNATLYEAQLNPSKGILCINRYTHASLKEFLVTEHHDSTEGWQQYLERRRAGAPREMFRDVEEAKWWLKNSAPVKYVDGAWLGHIAKMTTPFYHRRITKNAWQVMSEELGDGHLIKNHVYVYEDLMLDIDANLPAGWTRDFIDPKHQLNELRCWKAAVAQLLISLFPQEFLPEVLGFNMAYKGLPLHLLKSTKELKELDLNNYYFVLHVSIDNADSGHAAMAMEAAIEFIDKETELRGAEAGHAAWRRVQAGFILAEGLPTTPESPSLKHSCVSFANELEAQVAHIFASKAAVAHKIHCSSRVRIGSKSLVEWLEPKAFAAPARQSEFIHALANCRPWVVKGDSKKSKLAQESGWEGRMYGAFTEQEVILFCSWIDSLACPPISHYYEFTKRTPLDVTTLNDILSSHPYNRSIILERIPQSAPVLFTLDLPLVVEMENIKEEDLFALWFSSAALLENFVNIPAKVSNKFGSAVVRILRAQMGFGKEQEGVAGMDEFREKRLGLVEIGLELLPYQPVDLASVKGIKESKAANKLLEMAKQPFHHRGYIIGASLAFAQLHDVLGKSEYTMGREVRATLQSIAKREILGLEECLEHCRADENEWQDVNAAYRWAIQEIQSCLS